MIYNKNIIIKMINLPEDMILEIINYLDIKNYLNFTSINNLYHNLYHNSFSWKQLYIKHYNFDFLEDTYYDTYKLCYHLTYFIKKIRFML